MFCKSKDLKEGDVIKLDGLIYYLIEKIADGHYQLKHPDGRKYIKDAWQLDYYGFCKCEMSIKEFNSLPTHPKDYPENLVKKRKVDTLDNEEWTEIKISKLDYQYMLSSFGRVKRINYRQIIGNEILLSIGGDLKLGIKENVDLVRNKNRETFYIETLLGNYFSEDILSKYQNEAERKLEETLKKIENIYTNINDEAIDNVELFKQNNFSFNERKIIIRKKYKNHVYTKIPYTYTWDELASTGLLIEFIKDNYIYISVVNIIDQVVNDRESVIFNKIFDRRYRKQVMGFTNITGYNKIILELRNFAKTIGSNYNNEASQFIRENLTEVIS